MFSPLSVIMFRGGGGGRERVDGYILSIFCVGKGRRGWGYPNPQDQSFLLILPPLARFSWGRVFTITK